MAFPSTPLNTLFEMQLTTDEWVDITSYVRGDTQEATIEAGRPNVSATVNPTRASMVLNNRDGRFSPRNPRGANYGLFGRGTPVRAAVKPGFTTTTLADLSDTFNRTVAAGDTWGDADTGQTWNARNSSGTGKHSVSSGTGRLLISTTAVIIGSVIDPADASWHDVDYYATFTVPAATGAAGIRWSMLSRRYTLDSVSGVASPGTYTNGPFVQAICNTTGTVTLRAFTASQIQLGSDVTVAGVTHTGQALRMRLRTAGLTVMAKLWVAANSEPSSWQIMETDSTGDGGVRGPGSVSLSVEALTGNTNTPFTAQVDNVTVTVIEPRACVEVPDWPSEWTPGARASSRGDITTPTVGYGVMARLSRPSNQPPIPAIEHYYRAHGTDNSSILTAYWPLTDGNLSTAAVVKISTNGTPKTGTVVPVANHALNEYFAQGDLNAPWLDNVVALQGTDSIILPVQMTSLNGTSKWAVDFVRSGSESSTGSTLTVADRWGLTWQLKMTPATLTGSVIDPEGTATVFGFNNAFTNLYDGAPHHVRLEVREVVVGSEWDAYVYFDGVVISIGGLGFAQWTGVATYASRLAPLARITYSDLATHTTKLSVGHFAAWAGGGASIDTTAKAALGYTAIPQLSFTGETAGDRIIRLCQEEGVPLRWVGDAIDVPGDTSETRTVGPQPTASFWDLISQAVDTDQGILYEARDFPGLEYRTRRSIESQDPEPVALTYTTDGHLQPGLRPAGVDETLLTNDVTATRLYGPAQRYELTTGAFSTSKPPAGIGRVDKAVTVSVQSDSQALHHAEWLVNSSTVDEERWPVIPMSLHHMARHSLTSLMASVMRASFGDRVTVGGMSNADWLSAADIDQIVQGQVERLSNFWWSLDWNVSPASPYAVGIWDGSGEFLGRYDTEGSSLAAGATSSATSLSVASTGTLWTTAAGDFPFDVKIRGVRITVTNITGASSPQTFTVTRSVDGFDVALSSGDSVSLWAPTRWSVG